MDAVVGGGLAILEKHRKPLLEVLWKNYGERNQMWI